MATPFSPVTFAPEPIAIASFPSAVALLDELEPMAIALFPDVLAKFGSFTQEACAIGMANAVKMPKLARVNLWKSKRLIEPRACNLVNVEVLMDCVALP